MDIYLTAATANKRKETMSVKLTPQRLRQIVMEEAAAMRAPRKSTKLTESRLRQIIREELNEMIGGPPGRHERPSRGRYDPYDDRGEGSSSCVFKMTPEGELVDVEGSFTMPYLLDKLDFLGINQLDLEAALTYGEGKMSALDLGEDESRLERILDAVSNMCPGGYKVEIRSNSL